MLFRDVKCFLKQHSFLWLSVHLSTFFVNSHLHSPNWCGNGLWLHGYNIGKGGETKYEEWGNLHLKGESFFFFAVFQVLLALTVGTRVMITSCQGSLLKSRGEGWMPHVVSVSHAGEGDIRSIGFTFIRLTLASSNLVTFIICLETKEGVGHFHKTKSWRNKAWLRMSRGERLLPILAAHPLEGHCCANKWFFQVWYVPNRKPECERTLGLWIVQRVPVKNEMEEL